MKTPKSDIFKKTWFVMPYTLKPIKMKDDVDIRYPEDFAKVFIEKFTKKGDKILDPFAGFGTTLFVAQKLGRVGIGIEYDKQRYDFISQRLRKPSRIIHGDSLKIDTYHLPLLDFCMTSPPYMRFFDKENPMKNYTTAGNYQRYLADIRKIYSKIHPLMKIGSAIVLEVSNVAGNNHPLTPLAWDIARELSKIFFFEREYVYCHSNGSSMPENGCHSYCLLFRKK